MDFFTWFSHNVYLVILAIGAVPALLAGFLAARRGRFWRTIASSVVAYAGFVFLSILAVYALGVRDVGASSDSGHSASAGCSTDSTPSGGLAVPQARARWICVRDVGGQLLHIDLGRTYVITAVSIAPITPTAAAQPN